MGAFAIGTGRCVLISGVFAVRGGFAKVDLF